MSGFMLAILKGFAKSAVITLAICSIISVLMLLIDLSDSMLRYITILLLGLNCYLCAYFSTQINRSKGMLQGLISGAFIFTLTMLFSLIFSGFTFMALFTVKLAVCVFCGMIGGIKGVNTRQTKAT